MLRLSPLVPAALALLLIAPAAVAASPSVALDAPAQRVVIEGLPAVSEDGKLVAYAVTDSIGMSGIQVTEAIVLAPTTPGGREKRLKLQRWTGEEVTTDTANLEAANRALATATWRKLLPLEEAPGSEWTESGALMPDALAFYQTADGAWRVGLNDRSVRVERPAEAHGWRRAWPSGVAKARGKATTWDEEGREHNAGSCGDLKMPTPYLDPQTGVLLVEVRFVDYTGDEARSCALPAPAFVVHRLVPGKTPAGWKRVPRTPTTPEE
ncbi:MAG: hypothetical protein KC635_07380 [Myxococcales bacterium]|nr:hypothetical protein [Myxococcales bacterium]MCB9735665.1 hypothetical protein [Deltaproteobacteria bacterium]